MGTGIERPRVLVFSASYLPGYKGGGPIRSIANLVACLSQEFDFRVVTADRDIGDTEAYDGISPDEWTDLGDARAIYLSPAKQSMGALRRLLQDTEHDLLYLNSFFSPVFSIKPLALRALGLVRRTPVVLAPRGELCEGALQLKTAKKRAFMLLARWLGLQRGVVWAATSPEEAVAIRQHVGPAAEVREAPNLPAPADLSAPTAPAEGKTPGFLRILFLARISPKKNLRGALRLLAGLTGRMEFDIHGPVEDRDYWAECQAVIATLPGQSDRTVIFVAHLDTAYGTPGANNNAGGERYGAVPGPVSPRRGASDSVAASPVLPADFVGKLWPWYP